MALLDTDRVNINTHSEKCRSYSILSRIVLFLNSFAILSILIAFTVQNNLQKLLDMTLVDLSTFLFEMFFGSKIKIFIHITVIKITQSNTHYNKI